MVTLVALLFCWLFSNYVCTFLLGFWPGRKVQAEKGLGKFKEVIAFLMLSAIGLSTLPKLKWAPSTHFQAEESLAKLEDVAQWCKSLSVQVSHGYLQRTFKATHLLLDSGPDRRRILLDCEAERKRPNRCRRCRRCRQWALEALLSWATATQTPGSKLHEWSTSNQPKRCWEGLSRLL